MRLLWTANIQRLGTEARAWCAEFMITSGQLAIDQRSSEGIVELTRGE